MRKYNVPAIPDSIWQNPLHFIAFGFGSGAMPIAPGTFGTLLAIPFYLALENLSQHIYLLLVIVIAFVSSLICSRVSKEIGVEDHQGMCLDEFVGFFVTMLYVPAKWQWIVIGFILFRVFDIWKPWPIRYVDENIHSGFGMILDDVLAGIYSCLILQILIRIF